MKKHGTDGKRRVWRKLHIAVGTHTHEIIGTEFSLSNVTDAEVMPNLLKQTHRKICNISVDGAYDTRACHDAVRRKRALVLISPREGTALWKPGHSRNLAVSWQQLHGSNKQWKKRYGYHRRSISETAMYIPGKLTSSHCQLVRYMLIFNPTRTSIINCTLHQMRQNVYSNLPARIDR